MQFIEFVITNLLKIQVLKYSLLSLEMIAVLQQNNNKRKHEFVHDFLQFYKYLFYKYYNSLSVFCSTKYK